MRSANANAQNLPYFDLKALTSRPAQTVTATVVDPTPFVRDPEIRRKVLTATRSWTIAADRQSS